MMAKAQNDIAQAEMMKGRADLRAQEVKLKQVTEKQESDNVINLLKLRLQESESQAKQYKDGADLRFDYEKLVTDTALKLAEMQTPVEQVVENIEKLEDE